jgi:hypothetical protein
MDNIKKGIQDLNTFMDKTFCTIVEEEMLKLKDSKMPLKDKETYIIENRISPYIKKVGDFVDKWYIYLSSVRKDYITLQLTYKWINGSTSLTAVERDGVTNYISEHSPALSSQLDSLIP